MNDTPLTDQLPPLGYAQEKTLKYIQRHPRLTTEDITNDLAGWNNVAARYEIASAVGWLVSQGYCEMDARTGAITAREAAG